jgi:hypothetical protein
LGTKKGGLDALPVLSVFEDGIDSAEAKETTYNIYDTAKACELYYVINTAVVATSTTWGAVTSECFIKVWSNEE